MLWRSLSKRFGSPNLGVIDKKQHNPPAASVRDSYYGACGAAHETAFLKTTVCGRIAFFSQRIGLVGFAQVQ